MYVDDTEKIVMHQMREGSLPQTVLVGSLICGRVKQTLIEVGFEEVALPPSTTDRVQRKSNFIAWMAAHMAEAIQKCNAYKARPGLYIKPPQRMCWSARP